MDKSVIKVWITSPYNDDSVLPAVIHELGHNLGLMHSRAPPGVAGGKVVPSALGGSSRSAPAAQSPDVAVGDVTGPAAEYGDSSCPMGSAGGVPPPHFNAPQSWAAGWSVPLAVWDDTDLKPGVWRSIVLPPLHTQRASFLMLLPASWAGASSGAAYVWDEAAQVTISVRGTSGIEGNLLAQYKGDVQVHRYDGSPDPGQCASTFLVATLDSNIYYPASALAPSSASLSSAAASKNIMWPSASDVSTSGSGSTTKTTSVALRYQLAVRVVSANAQTGATRVEVCRPTSMSQLESGRAACSDGLDNDCDGLVDRADPACAAL